MRKPSILWIILLLAVFAMTSAFIFGKKAEKTEAGKVAPAAVSPKAAESSSAIAAKVGNRVITMSELDEASKQELMPLATQIYQTKKRVLDGMIQNALYEEEAKRVGKKVEEVKAVPPATPATVSDDAIEVYYDSNQARFSGKTLDQAKDQIRSILIQQKADKGRGQLLDEIKKRFPVQILIEEPKIVIETEGQPSRGPKNAKVTVVEFSEFQCPFCKKFKLTTDQIVKEYPNDVRHVFRHNPLPFHKNARISSKASVCADRQGKFWELRDVIFENQQAIDEASLRKYAEQVGLAMDKYDACIKDPALDKYLDDEVAYAQKVGARGTPTSFVNGVLFSGAKPYEELKKVVDEKLGKS